MMKNMEARISFSNKMYPLYDGLSKDLLFYIAIDTLFLTVAKGFSAFQISFLGVVPTLVCVLMQPILVKIVQKLGNVNSSRTGTFMLLLSSIMITFGNTFFIIAVGQLVYDIAFVLKNMESISLRNNLQYQNRPEMYMAIRGRSNTIYAVITFVIALVAGPLFNVSPYLPMYLCISVCIVTCILSFTFYEVKNDHNEEAKEKTNAKTKFSKIIILALLSNTIFLGVVVIGQQDSKLFIQYQLTDWFGISLTATYLGFIVASSRVVRIVLNILFNKYYLKLKKQIPIILSGILVLAFAFIIAGAVLPLPIIIRVLLMTLGFDLIIPMRDTFIIYMEDLLLKNSQKEQQQRLFANMELLRKLGKVVMNLIISMLLLRISLYYIMWIFLALAVFEIILSVKMREV